MHITQQKNHVAWYWKLRNEIRYFSEYLQEPATRCIAQLVLYFKKCTRYFFNATHQVKAIAIETIEVIPLVEIGCCLWCVHLHMFFPWFAKNRYKEKLPIPTFIRVLISANHGITFTRPVFLFKIDHSDGTVNTDYAMRKLDMNHLTSLST